MASSAPTWGGKSGVDESKIVAIVSAPGVLACVEEVKNFDLKFKVLGCGSLLTMASARSSASSSSRTVASE